MTPTEFPSITRNSMAALDETTCRWQPFSRSIWREFKRCLCSDFAFMLERKSAAICPI